MLLSDFKAEIAVTTTVCTILQYLSGVLVCRKFIKRGSSNDVSPLPFLCGLTSSALWVAYGFMIRDPVILIVNSTGLFLMIAYVSTYVAYSSKRYLVLRQVLLVVTFLSSVHVYTKVLSDHDTIKNHLGYMGCTMSLIFMAAPLTNLARVIKTKSTESLPFPLILMSMVVSTLWMTYGVIVDDDFLIYPNGIGCILSGFQLSLFAKYPSTSGGLPFR